MRLRLLRLIFDTPHLDWLLLTKRIGNARKMLPADWPYPNAGLGATIVTITRGKGASTARGVDGPLQEPATSSKNFQISA